MRFLCNSQRQREGYDYRTNGSVGNQSPLFFLCQPFAAKTDESHFLDGGVAVHSVTIPDVAVGLKLAHVVAPWVSSTNN